MKKLKLSLISIVTVAVVITANPPVYAQYGERFKGEIMMVGFNFCPRGWVPADGQLLSIDQHRALYALYGITYGGDGRTTFGLPELRGRVAMHMGNGPGLTPRKEGESGGSEKAQVTAGDQSINVGPPFQVVRFCVNLEGVYPTLPTRN